MKLVLALIHKDEVLLRQVRASDTTQARTWAENLGWEVAGIVHVTGFVDDKYQDIRLTDEKLAAMTKTIAKLKHELKHDHGMTDAQIESLLERS
jgi:hypothetical protein